MIVHVENGPGQKEGGADSNYAKFTINKGEGIHPHNLAEDGADTGVASKEWHAAINRSWYPKWEA